MNIKASVLIVEDELLIAQSLKKMLEEKYLILPVASSFAQAIVQLQHELPDLVLIDITLKGGKNGLELAEHITNHYKIPFIFLTANSEPQVLQKIISLKPKGYLVKPVQKVNLLTALDLLFAEEAQNLHYLKIGAQSHKIILNDLLYAECDHVYVKLFLEHEKTMLLRISMQNLLDQLPPGILVRINRREAVNPEKITRKTKNAVCINERLFKVSTKYSKDC